MKIEGQSDLALRVLLRAPSGRWSTPAAATAIGAPRNHVAKVIQRLAEIGVIQTFRGHGGGFEVPSATYDLSVGAVLRAMEGEAFPVACASGPCPLLTLECGLRGQLARAREAFFVALDGVTLATLRSPQTVVPGITPVVIGKTNTC